MTTNIKQPRDLSKIRDFVKIYKGAEFYCYSNDADIAKKADKWFDLFILNQKTRKLTSKEFTEFNELSKELYWENLDD